MRTPRDGHLKRIGMIKILAELGFSNQEMAQTLVVSRATVGADRRFLNIMPKSGRDLKERFPVWFFMYAELLATQRFAGETQDHHTVHILKRGFEVVLRVSEILAAMNGAALAVLMPVAKDTRTAPYRTLLAKIFNENIHHGFTAQTPEYFFKQHISELYSSKLRDQEVVLSDSFETLRDKISTAYLQEIAHEMIWLKPIWTDETADLVIQILDEMLAALTPKEKNILERRLGLKGTVQALVEIGNDLGISRTRVRDIEQKALRKLSRQNQLQVLRVVTKSSAELLEDALTRARRAQQAPRENKNGITTTPFSVLTQSIDEVGFSVRASNGLKNANIKTIGELVQITERDLLKSRNFGTKTINEIKNILAKMELHLRIQSDDIAR